MAIHRGKDVVGEVVDCLIMDVVFDFQETGGCGVGSIDGGVPDVLGVLDQSWGVVEISFCVEIEVCVLLDGVEERAGY
jgi:hypothetical protein